jgi:hypothetical protein
LVKKVAAGSLLNGGEGFVGERCGVIWWDSKADSISNLNLPSTIFRLDLKVATLSWL